MRRRLADEERHGEVTVCGRCQDVHIRWDNLMLSLNPDQFDLLACMITEARAALMRELGSVRLPMCTSKALVQQ